MSRENVELVRRVFEVVNRGGVDAALEFAADDCVWDWSNSIGPAKGVYRGKQQVREFTASFVEAFEEARWDPEEIIDVDDTRVIVVNHVRLRGRGSGVEVDAVGAQLWTIVDGAAQSVKLYQSKADALEAVGRASGSLGFDG
jgi:ketosteroid isomerase-like protein